MLLELTDTQFNAIKEVITESVENEHEVLSECVNYELSKEEVIRRSLRLNALMTIKPLELEEDFYDAEYINEMTDRVES